LDNRIDRPVPSNSDNNTLVLLCKPYGTPGKFGQLLRTIAAQYVIPAASLG
jgi:hypothetical protein